MAQSGKSFTSHSRKKRKCRGKFFSNQFLFEREFNLILIKNLIYLRFTIKLQVALTLEILKYGKRFHATVSFDTDTGLKQALALVSDYNPLMKDFPINDLLSATELDRIR